MRSGGDEFRQSFLEFRCDTEGVNMVVDKGSHGSGGRVVLNVRDLNMPKP